VAVNRIERGDRRTSSLVGDFLEAIEEAADGKPDRSQRHRL